MPYIAAVHCYALTKDEGITVPKLSSQTEKLRAQKINLEAPRYQIDFRGLSAYSIITDADKSIIRGMVNRSKKGVFATHSRKYGISAVQRMLPVLASDGASAEWYEGNNPTPTAGPLPSGQEQALSRSAKRLRSASFEIATPHQVATSTFASSSVATVVQPSHTSTRHEKKKKKGKNPRIH